MPFYRASKSLSHGLYGHGTMAEVWGLGWHDCNEGGHVLAANGNAGPLELELSHGLVRCVARGRRAVADEETWCMSTWELKQEASRRLFSGIRLWQCAGPLA